MKKENVKNTNKKFTKGFTLIELLVVVLIIGILAAIAIPQYQISVGKTKFATLKNINKSIVGALQRYYLVHDKFPNAAKDLDMDFNITSGLNDTAFKIDDEIMCEWWGGSDQQPMVMCQKLIFNTAMRFYTNRDSAKPAYCTTFSNDKTDKSHIICQQETGKTANQASCSDYGYCTYNY